MKKVGRPGPAFASDARIRVVQHEPLRPVSPKVVKTVSGWARHERVSVMDYYEEARRLGYPVKSLSSEIPKHWHDDIKIKFREARRG